MPPSLNNTLYLHTATTGCSIIAISGHGGGLEDTQLQPPTAPAECTSEPLPVINTARDGQLAELSPEVGDNNSNFPPVT